MPCPICEKPSEKTHAPFCSQRCREIDLHRWMSGQYAIPAVEMDDPEDGEFSASDENADTQH
jgi:uncharacterized protein